MTTQEGSKIIAEFMGLRPVKIGSYGFSITKDHCHCNEDTAEKAMDGFASIAKYHLSWDWLMPVIAKITNECEEPDELDGLKYALLCNDIDTAWIFVVDHINYLR